MPESIPVSLRFGGAIDDIVIANSVLGPITETATSVDPCAVDTLTICDSIVQGSDSRPALFLRNARACLDRCTLFGLLSATQCAAVQWPLWAVHVGS